MQTSQLEVVQRHMNRLSVPVKPRLKSSAVPKVEEDEFGKVTVLTIILPV
jgi:hypothetical protein